jgi:transcriptional regulator with XRE-family HTH domain
MDLLRYTQVSVLEELMRSADIFGKNLKAFRKALGLKQADVAKELNIVESSVSRWENGEYAPDSELIDRLCAYLKVTPKDLYNAEQEDPALPIALKVVNKHISKLALKTSSKKSS